MDEQTIRLVQMYGLDEEAHRREDERCRYARIQDNSTDLLRDKEEITVRVDERIRKRALRKIRTEYRTLKEEGKEFFTYKHYGIGGLETRKEKIPEHENWFIDRRMEEFDYIKERITYLERFLKHEKLISPEIKKRLAGTLAYLCAEGYARNERRSELPGIGFNALKKVTSEYTARELMKEWTSTERRREDDRWDI